MPKDTIQIPRRVLERFVAAGRKFDAAQEALEDFFLATNPAFIGKMRRLRFAHRRGRLNDWPKLNWKV